MLKVTAAVALLTAFFASYWVNPTAAWLGLGAVATLALARHIRQKDDAAEEEWERSRQLQRG